ncbi:MAG: amidohydrolase [Chloroflexota bacterium]|nr:amidohydrolase [Chloroflexota bacterium]
MSLATDLDTRLHAAVDATRDRVIETRRALHRHPELSGQEHHTAELLAARSADLGFTVRAGVGGTGVVADLDSGRPGPTLMLRADMDALPILELGDGRVATSETAGVMHACGHDGHMAMAIGAAEALIALRDDWSGRLRLCFQPAEETASGAMPMIADGAADGVDRVLGIHLWAPLETGRVAVKSGVIFGSADSFALTIQGRGGHGGMPHTAIDPVVVTAQVILALQSIISRETSPFSPAVITIGRVSAGTAFNVIADSAELLGTTRAIDSAERERLLQRVAAVASAVAAGAGAEARFEHIAGCPPVVSDVATAELVHRAAAATVGEDHVDIAVPITVGDDIACFLERAPGCYFLVGAGHPERGPVPPHHSAYFDIDEAALPVGVESLVRATLEVLG